MMKTRNSVRALDLARGVYLARTFCAVIKYPER